LISFFFDGGSATQRVHRYRGARLQISGLRVLLPKGQQAPSSNGNRTCVGLSQSPGFKQQASIPVHAKAAAVYLLHAAAGPEGTFGIFTIHFADGTSYSEYITPGQSA
jgi:hypothetical protein